jgi:hypothetical protein
MPPNVITDMRATPAAENDHVLTTATICFFMNDGDWTEHTSKGTCTYNPNTDGCVLRLFKHPSARAGDACDEQIQFRAGATILGRRASGWEWERLGARRLLFIFDEADVIARLRQQRPEDTYDACYRDNPQMWR